MLLKDAAEIEYIPKAAALCNFSDAVAPLLQQHFGMIDAHMADKLIDGGAHGFAEKRTEIDGIELGLLRQKGDGKGFIQMIGDISNGPPYPGIGIGYMMIIAKNGE